MKAELVRQIKEIYKNNGNIMEYLRGLEKRSYNTTEDIMISYDFQAGTYNKAYLNNKDFNDQIRDEYSGIINSYIRRILPEKTQQKNEKAPNLCGGGYKLLEAGIGEGTTFGPVLKRLEVQPECGYGFDLSWSRIKECRRFLKLIGAADHKTVLFVGDLFSIPLKDCSMDVVYTVHALEPNGGRERELLQELYRVAGQYLILFEPSYELADAGQRKRMEHHGYVRNLAAEAASLGYEVVEHRLLEHVSNAANPTAVMAIHKGMQTASYEEVLCDPVSKGRLIQGKSSYFSKDSLMAYPVIEDIPCLNIENAVLASKYLDHSVNEFEI